MNKTRMICVRMDEDLLARIDKLSTHTYRNSRSQVILGLLDVVTKCATDWDMKKMLTTWEPYSSGYVVKFGIPAEK